MSFGLCDVLMPREVNVSLQPAREHYLEPPKKRVEEPKPQKINKRKLKREQRAAIIDKLAQEGKWLQAQQIGTGMGLTPSQTAGLMRGMKNHGLLIKIGVPHMHLWGLPGWKQPTPDEFLAILRPTRTAEVRRYIERKKAAL